MSKNIPIGEVLKEYGYITEDQLRSALEEQKKGGNRRLGQVLLDMNFVSERQVLDALGKKLGYQVIDIDKIHVNTSAVAHLPKAIAAKYNVIPIDTVNEKLTLAMSDPLNLYAQEDIRQITGMPLDIVLCEAEKIKRAINYNYSEVNAKKAAMAAEIMNADSATADLGSFVTDESEGDIPVIKLLNSLLVKACSTGTSDIHIEPFEKSTSVRMRIDGVIIDYVTIPNAVHSALIARIKIMSNIDIAEKRLPQDGHFKTTMEGYTMNVRVSVIPTVFGEKACLRFLSGDTVIDRSGSFGMSRENYEKFSQMLNYPHGIIYITGPTGSGKTTTLYMVLEHMSKKQINISTIEDPVERNLPRINQMQVNTQAGLTFERGLRALLRQDPDVIMLGETRDAETAQISVRAAITGHLVMSTLHTNDAVSSIVRLADMGLPPYLISGSLIGVVAQRLMRKLCPQCSYEDAPTEEETAILGTRLPKIRRGKGCSFCNNTGYKGRISIHEIVLIDKEIRHMISNNASREDIFDYAHDVQGMTTLAESAAELVTQGITSVEEYIKVSYSI